MKRKLVYFEDIGPQNKEITFTSVKERLNGSGIKKIFSASSIGGSFFKDEMDTY